MRILHKNKHRFGYLLAITLVAVPMAADAKKLKPKYYKDCYAGYNEMRDLVPKPPVDVQKTAKTVGQVANIAGRFGGFGGLGGLGSAASTAATVAKYSETIADVAAFTESMTESFPKDSDRFKAYGERMKTEAAEMQQVAQFATASQTCYAEAYVALKKDVASGEMKAKKAKRPLQEIQTGVANISEMLEHATQYMDTNIDAYNSAMNQETSGSGLDLGKMLSLASQGAAVAGGVQALDSGPAVATGYTGSVHAEAHRQAMKMHYEAAGLPSPYGEPQVTSAGYFGGMSSLTTLASIGSINSGMGAAMAAEMAVGQANLNAAGYEGQPQAPAVMQEAQGTTDEKIAALIEAGADIQPYLDAYAEIKSLADIQKSVAAFVDNPL